VELNHPLATITPTLDGDVLAVLARHDVSFTTGQVHRVLNRNSEAGIRKVLVRLSGQGIVLRERVGNAYSYRFNRDHLAASPITELANLQRTLLSRIEERLASWVVPPVYAAVFGSAARGTMTADSDLDLFLVRADDAPRAEWDEQVGVLAADVTRWTGNDTRPVEYGEADLPGARAEPVLREVLADALTVAGSHAWLNRQLRKNAI
jgi:predicted transcriptional regulator